MNSTFKLQQRWFKWTWLICAILAISFLIGLLSVNYLSEELIPEPKSVFDSPDKLFSGLLLNNLVVGFFLLIGGLSLGIITGLVLTYNGFMWGLFFGFSMHTYGLWESAVMFVPHTVFEIVWIFLFASMGFKISSSLFNLFFKDADVRSLLKTFNKEFGILLLAGIAIVLAGVVVENFITQQLVQNIIEQAG